MTNEMIERCGKAMMDDCCPAIRMTDEDVKFYQRMASICIKAMREPTEEMIKDEDVWANALAENAKGVWQAMIDKALS